MQGAVIYHNEKPPNAESGATRKRMKKLVGDERNVSPIRICLECSIRVERYIIGVHYQYHLPPIIPCWGLPIIFVLLTMLCYNNGTLDKKVETCNCYFIGTD